MLVYIIYFFNFLTSVSLVLLACVAIFLLQWVLPCGDVSDTLVSLSICQWHQGILIGNQINWLVSCRFNIPWGIQFECDM